MQTEYGGPETLKVGKIDIPQPKENEVLIKIEATAVNRAEILQRKGLYPPTKGSSNIIGLEGAGYLLNNADEYTSGEYKNNKRVMALLSGGGYSDVVTCHKDHIIQIPDNMSFQDAAAIPETWLTAYQLINFVGHAKPDDVAIIHASASGVGCASLQIWKMQRIKTIAVASSTDKLNHSKSLGAYGLINYKETPDFSTQVKDLTNGKGASLILDCIGAQNFEYNISAASMDCRWVFYGAIGGVKLENLNLGKLLAKRINLLCSTLKNRTDDYKSKLVSDFTEHCIPKFKTGELMPIIDTIFNLSQVAEAHKRMEKNLNIGKIVMINDLSSK